MKERCPMLSLLSGLHVLNSAAGQHAPRDLAGLRS